MHTRPHGTGPWLAAAIGTAVLAAAPGAGAATRCAATGNGTVLTIGGAVSHPNRPPFNEHVDHFLMLKELKFDKAHAFTIDDLARLPQRSVTITDPDDHKDHVYTGPTLESVLRIAGATGNKMTLNALDGYQMDFTAGEIAALKPLYALCRDGRPLGLNDFGPGYLAFTPAHGHTPTDAEAAKMIFAIHYIAVE